MIKKCNCTHKYQDKKYGKNKRVHNKIGSSGKFETTSKNYRCTVCGDKKTI